MIIMKLTKKQAKSLSNILWDVIHQGGVNDTWTHEEQTELREMIDEAIEKNDKA